MIRSAGFSAGTAIHMSEFLFYLFLERCEAVPLVSKLMRCGCRQGNANGTSDAEASTMISDMPKVSPAVSPVVSPAVAPEARI
jgi:hypothetical protein